MECRTCKFFRTKPGLPEGSGECLGNPPTVIVLSGVAQAMYPVVEEGARCRHWRLTSEASEKAVVERKGSNPIAPCLQPKSVQTYETEIDQEDDEL